ncbi:hypothetical protein [Phorcysia thermohydrogeniphila]|uniref:VapB-type antitoxin n=1 Tax=Phorcysia thermohydrogeniphila TaxID=936138 RepID=A0A4R1GCX3_9BACT|nr:hypothetical protein [Phorcysia thermohydrogeniphila]TCK04673.1 hypothetical protein CLV27_1106 [Phorcysia thermohydrogeniphila]
MGEIVIKVPGDVKEVFTTVDEALARLKEFKDIENQRKALEFIIKNAGRISEKDLPSEEDIHWQEDKG